MDHDYIAGEIEGILNPKLEEDHREGATPHPSTRQWPEGEPGGDELTRRMDVARRLFYSSLRVFGDSILTYGAGREKNNPSQLRFFRADDPHQQGSAKSHCRLSA